MSLTINNNTLSQSAGNTFRSASNAFDQSLEKISSGKSINRASDDASGLVMANNLNSAANSIGQLSRNASDNISMIQIKEAALGQATQIIQGIGEKVLQAASDAQTPETRMAIQEDVTKSLESLNDLYQGTTFNGKSLLSDAPGLAELSALDLSSLEGAESAQEAVDSALDSVSSYRSALGSSQNQVESEISNLKTQEISARSSESQIRDVDIAEEVMNMKQLDLLKKTSSFAQNQAANVNAQRVATLLG
ncbi:flagellin [Desulfobacula phenolica]|uniref:Flagellin n=1 Tax=Desulfobacula phenolica TaxID=90732 RepID=A0A1H2EEL8_9BACT|nr:flagellin [Desulfobacula phenolica]SDT93575.1 flagellin [Desulfobacula phenolica]